MTILLTLRIPGSNITLESDNLDKMEALSSFCKEELQAYHASEDVTELSVDELSEEQLNKLNSLLVELGIS